MNNNHNITDFDIQALIDNELDWEEEKRVWSILNSRPDLNKRYNILKKQKDLLKKWWKDH